MAFLSSFEAVRYRGIDGLSFPRLTHVNLVTGVNGIGKTAVIEAMWLFTGRYNTSLLWNLNVQRSNRSVLDPVAKLTSGSLELKGVEKGLPCSLKATFKKVADVAAIRATPIGHPAEGGFMGSPVAGQLRTELDETSTEQQITGMHATPWGAVVFHTPEPAGERPNSTILSTGFQHETPKNYLQIHSDMVRQNRKDGLRSAINLILPKVRDVEILTDETGESYLSAVTDGGVQLPLHDLGGGVVRLYQLFLSFFVSRHGMLLADEVENGLHHSVLGDVWTHVRAWLRQWNVQLVATTHSGECIQAAMAAFEDAPDDLAIHKLFRNEETGNVDVTTFTGEALEGARNLNLETR